MKEVCKYVCRGLRTACVLLLRDFGRIAHRGLNRKFLYGCACPLKFMFGSPRNLSSAEQMVAAKP